MNVNELIVVAVSVFVAGMGAFGLASPAGMAKFVSSWQSRAALWAASVVRLVFGIALWQAASLSRSPAVFKVLGVLMVVSAFGIPLIGVSRFKAILQWWAVRSPMVVRSWSAAALLTGSFLLWSVSTG